MTKSQATQFKHYSVLNAKILEGVCPECKAYEDWYTYRRWLAQGEQVAKGSTGTKIRVFDSQTNEVDDKGKKIPNFPHTATVFCRHQLSK